MTFCFTYNVTHLSPSVNTVLAYIEHLAQSLTSHKSVMNYLSAIKHLHRLSGAEFTAFSAYPVSLLIRALPLTMTSRSAPKHPITPSLLHVICRVCDHIPRVGRVLKAAYLLAFFAFLRRSNLAPNSSTTFDPTRHTRRGDVTFQEPGAVITLRWSKTMQDGTRSHEIPIPSIPNHPLDPVAAIKDMYRQIPTRTSDDPFLMLPDRSPVTTRLLATALHSILRESGFPANNYSLHSLRRGGATAAFRAGAEVHDIQRHGTWRSSCVWEYIAACGVSDSPIAMQLGEAVRQT